ncbi:poly-beta-hydroxybutyrate polymerase [Mycolicibacterium chitae]|uniref:Poly(3-hydroxyalkanoate) synthetase n=1 Tax=Mycolicibacterium chitae TaxID=1792 RepID=A0A448I6H9_MYCCI|nr:class I poly(R)-hydroxyalkanoic acid synthase [Mycolicibacterium chitae]MCV7108092.1 class I poly(R)-hydroxyalkanoic acid synthase [Mycolicibacterium chitae]BBZ04498.1 poly-beta-hydroxybutyrate polymerase [Mycolicibacterium chitae]VEG48131.1 poly(3-hydroxyalkanoate) synthetase [Mycolicibacterium chitae]
MSQPSTDATRWFTDLVESQQALLTAAAGGPEIPVAKQWTEALAASTEWQLDTWNQLTGQWAAMFGLGPAAKPIADRRFAGEAWTKDPRFEATARAYLTQVDLLTKALEAAPLDERSKGQWSFALRQVVDALSPANNLMTNPEAQQLALETGGRSLIEGMRLFTEDLAKGRVSMTDESAFEVGENVATTPGAVIYQNELIQVIQYTPTTDEVHERPLVIIPPCINKFYILDLQPENSFVAHAVAEGHPVFLLSWRNIGPEQGQITWDDYVVDGVLQAIDVALDVTGADKANTLGFCAGGTLLASALGVLQAGGDQKAASMTLLTTLLDFTDTGEIGLLVDEASVAQREARIGNGGVLQGSELAQVFSLLRANDLIWPYVVKGYLQGQAPPPFDLLYWNSDDTNLPGPMFSWYLRNLYLENKLREPGGTVQAGVPVDLGSLDIPSFVYASRADHIVPWTSAYASTQFLGGKPTFVLGASGHIAGVINPPAKNKRNYWVSKKRGSYDPDPEKWLDSAKSVPGSWWPVWHEWLAKTAGDKVAAPQSLGSGTYTEIEPAPGSYVKEKAPKP